jgi:hypothetical protein
VLLLRTTFSHSASQSKTRMEMSWIASSKLNS